MRRLYLTASGCVDSSPHLSRSAVSLGSTRARYPQVFFTDAHPLKVCTFIIARAKADYIARFTIQEIRKENSNNGTIYYYIQLTLWKSRLHCGNLDFTAEILTIHTVLLLCRWSYRDSSLLCAIHDPSGLLSGVDRTSSISKGIVAFAFGSDCGIEAPDGGSNTSVFPDPINKACSSRVGGWLTG